MRSTGIGGFHHARYSIGLNSVATIPLDEKKNLDT